MFFDYFYEHEAEQFAFYMIPKEIVEDKPFCELSDGSKLLYSITLDRVKRSAHSDLKIAWPQDLSCVSGDWGFASTSRKPPISASGGNGWFGIFVATNALLAIFLNQYFLYVFFTKDNSFFQIHIFEIMAAG